MCIEFNLSNIFFVKKILNRSCDSFCFLIRLQNKLKANTTSAFYSKIFIIDAFPLLGAYL